MKIGRFVHGTKEFPERRMKKDEFLLFGLFFTRLEVGSVHMSIKFGFLVLWRVNVIVLDLIYWDIWLARNVGKKTKFLIILFSV